MHTVKERNHMEDTYDKVLRVLDDIKDSLERNSSDEEELERIDEIKKYLDEYDIEKN